MKKSIFIALCMAVVSLLGSCDAEEQYNSHYACNFAFYTQHHPESSLAKVNETNPGYFVIVEVKKRNGVNTVYCCPNRGDNDSPLSLTEEVENNRLNYDNMGANGRLIIGCTTLNGLKAYDGHCPVCLDRGGGTNYPLAFSDNGENVKCSKCNNVFSLNAEGGCTSGVQSRLLQYHVFFAPGYDGTTMLRVTN